MGFFELREIALRKRQRIALSRPGRIGEPRKVSSRQLLRTVDGEVGHQWHAIIFEVAEPQRSRLPGVIGCHGAQQVLPVCGQRRRPFAAHRGQILLAVFIIRHREHAPVRRQPFHLAWAVEAIALLVPARRIGAAEAMQHLLRHIERQVGAGYLDRENDKVDIIEKIQIDMPDIEHDGRLAPGESDANLCDIGPAVNLDRRFAVGSHRAALGALAIQKALHIRQKRHELAVMPFLEGFGIGAEFIIHFLPDPIMILLQELPVTVDLRKFRQWQQLERPDQNLVERAHQRHGFHLVRRQARLRDRLTDRLRRHSTSPDISRPRLARLRPRLSCLVRIMPRKPHRAYMESRSAAERRQCCCDPNPDISPTVSLCHKSASGHG